MSRKRRFIGGLPGNETIHYRYNHKMECIFIKDIAYIESHGVYSLIYIDGIQHKKKEICKAVINLEGYLMDKGFIRCHRHYLVNTVKVKYFCSKRRILSVYGEELPVSVRKSTYTFRSLLDNGIEDVNVGNVETLI